MQNKSALRTSARLSAAIFLALLFLILGVMPATAQQQSVSDADREVNHLAQIVQDEQTRQNEQEHLLHAIQRLAELGTPKAINILIDLLTYRRTFPQEQGDPNVINGIHLITPAGRYPAIGALFQIGKPALPALVNVIATHESDSLRSQNATTTIMYIFRESPAKGVEFLNQAALDAPTQEAKQRLLYATEKAKGNKR
jgi:hypothetical protein